MNKVHKILMFGGVSLSALCSFYINADSLESVVAQALETHPDIRQSFARFKAKEEDVNNAFSGYLPTVDITAGYGYEYTDTPSNRRNATATDDSETELKRGEFGLSIKQALFGGLLTRNEIKRTKYEASAEQWTLIATAEDLALQISAAYLNFIKTEQLISLSEKNIASHQDIYEQIKERTDSGLGSVADLSQITGRLARAQSNLIAARNNFLDARAQYIRLTNIQPNDLIIPVPDADLVPSNRNTGLELAKSNHPVIKSSQQDINAARSFKKSIKANYAPKITLEIEANADNNIGGESGFSQFGDNVGGHRNDASVMLRVKYNLFNGGKDLANERAAAYGVVEAQGVNYSANRQVEEGYVFAWNAFEMLNLQKKYIKIHVTTAKDTHLAYREQFSLGQRSLLDLLDTENELFEARQDYLNAEFDELSAQYRLLNATGQLLDSLRVTRANSWKGEHNYNQGAFNE